MYIGTHPGGDERVLWFRLEHGPGSDGRFYPTVYTLWQNPNIVPLLHTPDFVMQKLQGGADLMTPGLANDPPFPERAVKGAVVAVAGLDSETVPLFIGVCEVDVAGLGRVQGTKGHAIRGVHWQGDELWAWSSASRPGQHPPEYLKGWDVGDEEEEGEEEEGEEEVAVVEEGVSDMTLGEKSNKQAKYDDEEPLGELPEEQNGDMEQEPSTKGMSFLFFDLGNKTLTVYRNRRRLCERFPLRSLQIQRKQPISTGSWLTSPHPTVFPNLQPRHTIPADLYTSASAVLSDQKDQLEEREEIH